MSEGKVRVLFVCVENSNRSQMAQAFARIGWAFSGKALAAAGDTVGGSADATAATAATASRRARERMAGG